MLLRGLVGLGGLGAFRRLVGLCIVLACISGGRRFGFLSFWSQV